MTKYEKIVYMQQCLQIAKEEIDKAYRRAIEVNKRDLLPSIKTVEDERVNVLMNQSLVNDNLRNVARIAFQESRR